jgi:hypothetical protein
MAATSTNQSQSGSDTSTTVRTPTLVESTRVQPAQVTRQVGAASTSTTTQRATTTQQKPRQRVGCEISFTIKINGGLPPITT